MHPGAHQIELATFVVDGATILESDRAGPLNLVVATTKGAGPSRPLSVWPRSTVSTSDGLRLRLEQIANDLIDPTDLAFAPDGRAFIAERDGKVRVLRDGQLLATPALSLQDTEAPQAHLVALAVDPQFVRTQFVYMIYTTPSASGGRAFNLARFREAGNMLADRVVLRDDIRASPDEAASLRFGADSKAFAAFDDGGIASLADDLASPNGKVLRLNPDGTTPHDQASGSPLYSFPFRSPRGFDWDTTANTLWVADRDSDSTGRLVAVGVSVDPTSRRGVVRTAFALPRGTLPSSVAFYRGDSAMRSNLLIASEEGGHLLKVQLDSSEPPRVVATEPLLQDTIGGIRLVAVGPDGTIYLATADAIGTLRLAE
jgi:glucose/arabinose dehydrogenase